MDPLARSWHELHAKNIYEREKTHDERLRRRRLGLIIEKTKSSMRMHMKVPVVMNLFENYEQTINFINDIKENVFKNDLFVLLDFSACSDISSETCVVLAAEIDRCNKIAPKSVTGSYPNHSKVYFFLNEIGFFQLLGIKATKPIFDNSPDISAIRLQSGSDNPESLMKGVKELFYTADGTNPQSPYSGKVYRALTEAMANAVEHGYPEKYLKENEGTCVPKWWRAGFKLHEKNDVLMILYDQGAGIPNTLITNWREQLEELMSFLAREPYDDEKLALAMEKGRTRTKVEGRGQGSYDMQTLIRESSESVLSIMSYRGRYSYLSDGTWSHESLLTPLHGTLVIWKVCLNTQEGME